MADTTTYDLPTKKTLDDIENFGIQFSNGFTAVKNITTQNFNLAKKYIVTEEIFDNDGIRTGYTFHPNIEMFPADEKEIMLAYFDFLKSTYNQLCVLENMNGHSIYDIMNTRSKLDQLISLTMKGVLIG